MLTKQRRETKKYPQSEGNLTLAEESFGVFEEPKAEIPSPGLGAAQDIPEEQPDVDAFAPAKGIIFGIGLSLILWCLFFLISYWIR